MGNEPQTLTEMPLWVLILLAALGGVSGEMWRADKAGLGGWALLRRLALRSGASIVCGVAVMLLALACGAALLFAAALGSLTAAAGAENSKNFVSKFGRAKSYGAQTIGTPDAGAMSMAYFFRGLAQDSSESN